MREYTEEKLEKKLERAKQKCSTATKEYKVLLAKKNEILSSQITDILQKSRKKAHYFSGGMNSGHAYNVLMQY